jgi:hypothetical protein
MEFERLEPLRIFLKSIGQQHIASLRQYHDQKSNGFYHRHDKRKPGKFSTASTATCVLSLTATDNWNTESWGTEARTGKLGRAMLRHRWTSAELPPNNVFSTAFTLEMTTELEQFAPDLAKASKYRKLVKEAEDIIRSSLRHGYAELSAKDPFSDYPPSAYLTQLAVRVLRKRKKLTRRLATRVQSWASSEIAHQLALLGAQSKTADLFQLAYCVMLVSALNRPGTATPDQSLLLNTALDQLFERQQSDGSWPRSRPLFHYPGVGNAYCYEYEMLTQLLEEPGLSERLLKYLPKLQRAANALADSAFELEYSGRGWSSGHHPQLSGPESWSTASVYHFAHALSRLVAEAIRRAIFASLDTPYVPQATTASRRRRFAASFVDCPIQIGHRLHSLRRVLFESFVQPVSTQAGTVARGRSMSDGTAISAIFFGPPGTSKTELTRSIADYLEWPRLIVDPSHFVRNGLDRVQAEADKLFGMLVATERVVVLLDEFDEMVRDRTRETDLLSRFLTTAMLPKLANINKNKRIIFVVATNYLDHFDLAISRQGRFDLILPIMPPTVAAKFKKWPELRKKLRKLGVAIDRRARQQIGDLTFLECQAYVEKLQSTSSMNGATRLLQEVHTKCSLQALVDPQGTDAKTKDLTWKDVITKQLKEKTRIPYQ